MSPKEVIEFFKTKTRQLVARKKMEEFRDRAKQFASRENIRNMAAKAKGVASKENVANVITKAKEIATKENMENFATKAKSLASKEKLDEAKQCVKGLVTEEGRSALVHRFSSLSSKNKVLIICMLLAIIFVCIKCVTFIGGSIFGSAERVSINDISVDLRMLSDDSLDLMFLNSSEVPVGTIFDHSSSPAVRIMNVVESGVLVHYVGSGDYNKIIHIMTDPAKYADGNELKSGIYVRTGSYKYKSMIGLRKVESYLDISSEEMEKKISEYKHRLAEVRAKKLMSREGKALDVDLHIKSICGFVMGGTPSQNWHLFEQSKNTQFYHKKGYQQHRQEGALINPFRQFKTARATYTFYDGVPEHLYEVELETEWLSFWEEELENVKSLLEKKFKIKMTPNPNPCYLSSMAAYMWEGDKGEKLMIEEGGTRLRLILRSYVIDSMDKSEMAGKKEDEERSKIMPANEGIEAL